MSESTEKNEKRGHIENDVPSLFMLQSLEISICR
ncbi:Hypothetical protein Tpal_1833 [Trichococcus palustris]|jgi:hypothetical protein|uniref:Uncharacterized protein n=1 Tax=Trichococcus palustris TaxID=140314 RepID=A0A143YP34_9LACT|nr:Hypothetical protein Tpal_1833 [Trichococcus palustris]